MRAVGVLTLHVQVALADHDCRHGWDAVEVAAQQHQLCLWTLPPQPASDDKSAQTALADWHHVPCRLMWRHGCPSVAAPLPCQLVMAGMRGGQAHHGGRQ